MHTKYVFERSHIRIKEIFLLCVCGFFLGGIIFFLFRNSILGDLNGLSQQMTESAKNEIPFFSSLVYIWGRRSGEYAALWIASETKIRIPYIVLYLLYKGFSIGFLFSFFAIQYGLSCIHYCIRFLLPHQLLLIPVYLCSLYIIGQNQKKYGMRSILILYIFVMASCIIEVKWNLPWMQALYRV